MDSLEEIKKDFKALEERLNKLEKKDNKRWRAEKEEELYFYVDSDGDFCKRKDMKYYNDGFKYKTRNYFKTAEEAQAHLDNIIIYYDLMDLAEELNDGEEIDWENGCQEKFGIYYDFGEKKLSSDAFWLYKAIGQIYCLDSNFLEKAKERIGEIRLIKLFKGE